MKEGPSRSAAWPRCADKCAGDDFRADFHAENSLDTATSNNNGAALVAFLLLDHKLGNFIGALHRYLVRTGHFATNPKLPKDKYQISSRFGHLTLHVCYGVIKTFARSEERPGTRP
jgi:hypothetical protein